MRRFEYKVVPILYTGWKIRLQHSPEEREDILNKFGKEGWELVAIHYGLAYLKRDVPAGGP